MEHDVGFLRHGGHHKVGDRQVVVLSLGVLGVVDEFGKFHSILLKQDSRVLALAQLPSEHAIHLHAVAVVHFHFLPSAVGDELLLHNVAHLDEAPYLIQSGNVFRLQAIYAIVERICTAQQVPSAVHLRISCGFLKHEALGENL